MMCDVCEAILTAEEQYESENGEILCRRCYLESQEQKEYDIYFDDIDLEVSYE